MTKTGLKTRNFQWWSGKNGALIRVHSKAARDYGKWLEVQPEVEAFEAGKALELERLPHVNPTGIRKLYFQPQWCSDFYIKFADGHIGVRELAASTALDKQAEIEKLELSRRYWAAMDIIDWKVVLIP
ncbi:MAG: hypothetical protein HFF20_00750 [Oscillospiraceae bacterium]|uniref:hypothetical protein n=1 Tax=Acutalibacter muris TaxID=1796620 RepID=UPI00216F2831|nr:hypothetical protein [Acutalibacter muris]MCI9547745.1 hypothetical protein [Oscillospiraceae bacterium]